MNEQDKQWWETFRLTESNTISGEEHTKISELHAIYFNHTYYKPCGCNAKKIQRWIDDLNKLYFGN